MAIHHPKVAPGTIRAYADIGVAHVSSAVGAHWVTQMTKVIDDIVHGLRRGTLKFGKNEVARTVEFEDHGGYMRLTNVYHRSAEMRALVEESDLAHIVADVIGSDEMRPWMDGTFMKEGEAAETATPWHNDECLFPLSGSHSPSMWIALTDVDRNNAPLQTLVGSSNDLHRYKSSWALEGVEVPDNFHPWSELLERVKAKDADIRIWEVKAGDMLVIHPKTIHASLPRKAGVEGRRLGFSLRWLGSDNRYEFNPTARTSPFQASNLLVEGGSIPDALFPATWKRKCSS